MLIDIEENGIRMVVGQATKTGSLCLLHLSQKAFQSDLISADERLPMVDVQRGDAEQDSRFGSLHIRSNSGGDAGVPVYQQHSDRRNAFGRKLEFVQKAGDLLITSVYQFFDGIPVVKSETILENQGIQHIPIEYVSSLSLYGLGMDEEGKWNHQHRIHLPFNSWTTELQWRSFSLAELGLTQMRSHDRSMRRISKSNTGSLGAKEMLPMGCLEHIDDCSCCAWQIETHGSWHWELAETSRKLYLQLSGPTEQENQWHKVLRPGELFSSVPVAIAMADGFDEVFQALNTYRRRIRRPNADNRDLPVIFNDYMNCLEADPTTEKLLPLIDKAASLGAEYYVIDAGWYADGIWWSSVGEWQESRQRFPNGLQEIIDHIIDKGMKPGLWLEIERMGKNCPLVTQWPDECFFCRHGKRVVSQQSLQLDFRHPTVRCHADQVIDRLVKKMGVRFIKMDYNFEIGMGTEIEADSFGDGLLLHQRVYLDWLDTVFERYPELVIENCSSGGLRNTYSMLSRQSICSTTDNTDYLANAKISINSATAYCMEQAGVWSYPLATASDEEVIMNMVSCMSWRPYLSGQIWALSEEKLDLIREGVRLYKDYLRPMIPHATPFWPLGLVKTDDKCGAFGFKSKDKIILSVWNFDEVTNELKIDLKNKNIQEVKCIYPATSACQSKLEQGVLSFLCSPLAARIFELK